MNSSVPCVFTVSVMSVFSFITYIPKSNGTTVHDELSRLILFIDLFVILLFHHSVFLFIYLFMYLLKVSVVYV